MSGIALNVATNKVDNDKKPIEEKELNTSSNSKTAKEELDEDLKKEYLDKRTIVILPIHNYSFYRKANMKVFGQKRESIGSCIRSSLALSADKYEVEKYFPNIIGISPSHPDFVNRVKQYLNNIKVDITDKLVLNASFIYEHKEDYYRFKALEEEINEKYEKANKIKIKDRKDALEDKIESINTLETMKAKVGRPQNFQEYIIYRHCLLYKDVAKDNSLINSDSSIRFYIKDEAKEKEKQAKMLRERINAKQNYVEMLGDKELFNSMVIQYAVSNGQSVQEMLLKDKTEKELLLDRFSVDEPDKFNKLFNDKNLKLKSFIETLIAKGELIRSEFNQNIISPNGDFIGANMNEAIGYFNNPNNVEIRKAYENKLKYI